MLDRLLDSLFPRRCVFCRKTSRRPVCDACQASLPWITEQGVVVAPLRYEGLPRLAMHRYKYGGYALYDRTFGQLLAQAVRDADFSGFDACTFVPCARSRVWRRGYDQAKRLCKAAAGELGLPWRACLRKRRRTRSLVGMKGDAERRENTRGAFAAKDSVAVKRILLIDDVRTTGATLSACRAALLDAGAGSVCCAVAMLARKEPAPLPEREAEQAHKAMQKA